MSDTTKVREISGEDLDLLSRMLEQEGFGAAVPAAIPRRDPAAGEIPLSYAQQRLWFLDRLDPNSAQYNLYSAFRFPSRIAPGLLARAVAEVVARHESLRTTFAEVKGKAVQVVHPVASSGTPFVPLRTVDLVAVGEGLGGLELQRIASAEARRPFDLARGPLLRALLLRSASGDALLATQHHVISDGGSMAVLLGEVGALYATFSAGRASRAAGLRELPIQYPDFALWQRGHLAGDELDRQLSYWRGALAGAPQVLELPSDRPRPAKQSFRGASEPFSLPPDLADSVRGLARAEGATTFMALLAGLQALIGRYTGSEDFLIGAPIANRNRPELEGMIGFLANTLVLRADLSGNPTFRTLVRRAKERTLAAYDHQDLPFEKLVEELKPERDLAHAPLAQVVLALQAGGAGGAGGGGVEPIRVEHGTAKFDLTLSMIDGGQAGTPIGGMAELATDLFDMATVRAFVARFARLLAAGAANPDQRLADLPLLDDAERRAACSTPRSEPAPPFLLHRRFHEVAAARPNAPAVTCGERTVSYGEVARKATALARKLRAAGVGPESRVGLCLDRSVDLPVAILAVLEAGGVYVPLDPTYPAERNAYVLEDTAARWVVTRGDLDATLPSWVERVLVDGVGEGEPAGEAVPADLSPVHAAYVIHTSGSTGKPKGVVISHANVARLFTSTEPWFGFGPDDVWTLFHSYAFDFSVWELWGALLYGGRLVVVPYLVSRSPEDFRALLAAEKVTVLSQTPSAFAQLDRVDAAAMSGGAERLPLTTVVFGGEALDLAALSGWFGRYGDDTPALVNMYGITETTVHVTYRRIRSADLGAKSRIGEPIPDLSINLLDAWGELAPVGVPGEILVGGAGLSRGYLGRPELTAQRFVPALGAGQPGARLYRSGDLGRRLADGDLEYLGRIDTQVKIRGFRIELGEIESALSEHPGVREAIVLARGDRSAPRLVAYATPSGGQAPSVADLRAHLSQRLPDYMIPAAFVTLEALPLTAQGKIDRKALPEPASTTDAEAYVAPRNLAEETLAAIWEQVLEVDRVGIHDGFFALGGDSIRSIQVLALARERGLEISLQQLFEHQTIAELAAHAGRAEGPLADVASSEPFSLLTPEDRQRLPSGPDGRDPAIEDAYPLAQLQAGMLFHMVLRPEDPPYHNVDSWQLVARFDEGAFARATADVVARHPVMRTSFHLTGYTEPIQIVHARATVPLTVKDLTGLAPEDQQREVASLVRAEKKALFDFTQPPQIRFFVHVLSPERFQFTLTENHAIFDGWSLHSTLAEIFGRYFAFLRGENPLPEPPLPLVFRDFIAAERRTLASAEAKAFWSERLAGATMLALPRRTPVAEAPDGPRVHRHTPNLSPEVSDGVRALARRLGIPLKSVLLGGHFKVMSLLSGSPDVMIGLGFNGRAEVLGGEDVRGLFLNTLPIRFRVADESFARISERAFETERSVLPFRRYPYSRLQQEHGGQPFYDVIFNYIHFHVANKMLAREGVALAGFQAAEGTSFLLQAAFAPGSDERGIHFALEYDSARLSDDDAAWIAGYYTRYFAALAEDAERSSATLALLSAEEREQIRAASALPPAVDSKAMPTLVDLFGRSAAAHGAREAVRAGDQVLTYAELDARAKALARRLVRSGVRPGDLIAVSLDRSLDLPVALVAVLQSGAGYVPIDPTYPEDRKALLREDSGARLTIDAGMLADLDHDLGNGDGAELPKVDAGDVAYVIYTSGSTGKPKGVPVRHGEVARLLSSTEAWFGFGPDDVWTLFHSYAFDFSVWEIWGAFAYGGLLEVVPTEISRAPETFYRLVRDRKVTVLNQTPSAFQQFVWAERGVIEADGATPLSLRYVIFGGEALDLPALAPWFERHPEFSGGGDVAGPRLVNMYGITETTVHVTYRPISKADVDAKRGSLVGVPIPDLAIQVTDAFGIPAPLGVPGEMIVAGSGLAVGYLGRPELSAERFVPDAFSGRAGARAYRSGDLARRVGDGGRFDLEYLGRIDNQVKIRGFRIELAEIEATLAAEAGVRRAIVVPREDVAGDKRLVAYVVSDDGATNADALRAAARAKLPEYMVPAAVVLLPELPLTAHGKVDLRALPLPAGTREGSRREFVEPRTPLEEKIAAIWIEVLRVEKVGVRDGFFDLGGNSILATQVFARLRETFGFEVPMRTLFEEPTIERLAATVGELMAKGPSAEAEAQRIAPRRAEAAAAPAPRDAEKLRTELAAMTPDAIRKLLAEKRAKKQQGGQG